MTTRLTHITIDCHDAAKLAAFWSAVVDVPVGDGGSEFFAQLPTSDSTPTWFFIQVPEDKTVKNRVHLDLESDAMSGEVLRLVGLGATHIEDKNEFGHSWSVFNDPEGNEFCVAGPHGETPASA